MRAKDSGSMLPATNEMVEDLDVDRRQCLLEADREVTVGRLVRLRRRGWLCARDHRCRVRFQRELDHFARIDAGLRDVPRNNSTASINWCRAFQ